MQWEAKQNYFEAEDINKRWWEARKDKDKGEQSKTTLLGLGMLNGHCWEATGEAKQNYLCARDA